MPKVLPLFGLSLVSGAKYSALENVRNLLSDMVTKGEEAKQAEATVFTSFDTWAVATTQQLTTDIANNQKDIDSATATISGAAGLVEISSTAIVTNNDIIAAAKEDIEMKKYDHGIAVDTHNQNDMDLTEARLACDNAIAKLQAIGNLSAADTSFLQKALARNPEDSTQLLLQKLKTVMDPFKNPMMLAQQPAQGVTHRREHGLDPIIELIEQLEQEFETEQKQNGLDHTEAVNTHDLYLQAKNHEIATAQSAVDTNTVTFNTNQAKVAKQTEILNAHEATKQANVALLEALGTEKADKTTKYTQSEADRTNEIEALKRAIEILSSSETTTAEGHLTDATTVSFIQLSRKIKQSPIEVATSLRKKAREIRSDSLAQIASAVSSGGALDSVVELIQNLLETLEQTAAEEAATHGQCVTGYSENDDATADATTHLNTAQTLFSTLETSIDQLNSAIADATAALERDRAMLVDLTAQRNSENAVNTQVISDSDAGAVAIGQAIETLEVYYASIAGNEVHQLSDNDADTYRNDASKEEYAGASYQGQDGQGVIKILEVSKSDAEKLATDTGDLETSSQDAFVITSEDLDQAITQTEAQNTLDSASRAADVLEHGQVGTEVGNHQATLEGLATQRADLDSLCQAKGVTFEERSAKRKEEIESLKAAYEALSTSQ